MQHKRITMLSSSETCHLGSSSSNPVIDQQSLLPSNPAADEQNLHPHSLENEDYPNYLFNGHEVGMSSGSMNGQQNTDLSLWDSAGSSSMGCLVDHDTLLQTKRGHFSPALSIGRPLTIEGRRHEGISSLPSHNLNIDLNLNQADQFDIGNDMDQSNGQIGTDAFTLSRSLSSTEHALRHEISSNVIGSSSQTVNLFDGASGQEVGVLGGHHSSIKRKNAAGSIAESSANGSSRNHHHNNHNMLLPSLSTQQSTTSLNMHTSMDNGFTYPANEQLNRNTDAPASFSSDPYSLSRHPSESERFLRNTRMRIIANEYDQLRPNLLPEGSSRCSAYHPTHQLSSFTPVQPRAVNSSASSHHQHSPPVTQFSQSLRRYRPLSNGSFGPRMVMPSSSTDTINQRSASQDPSRSLRRSNLPEPVLLGSSLFSTDSTNLLSAPGSRGNQQNSSSGSTLRAAINVGPQQVPGLNASQTRSVARGSADTARRSLLAASVPHSRSPGITLQHHGHSSLSHEIQNHQPGSSSRANLQHYSRAVPPSIDMPNSGYMDLHSFMQSIASSREGGRTVSELRHAVEQIRQGRNAGRLEELLIDRSLIRRVNLIDRHREMRLDVDNMSYEELLALGERIGHVNTGLTEEKIMSGLKHWKYLHIPLKESPTGVEPCCICQEDYADGEDMGQLDCGHDFHTACIKQWLVIKNMCPICKKSALGT